MGHSTALCLLTFHALVKGCFEVKSHNCLHLIKALKTSYTPGVFSSMLISSDGCPMEQGLPYLPYFPEFRITWPESEIGQTATESCACGNLDTVTINYQATRVCGGNYRNGAAWRTQDVSQCIFSNTTLQLCRTIGVSFLASPTMFVSAQITRVLFLPHFQISYQLMSKPAVWQT